MTDLYCSMIHGGMELSFKNKTPMAQHCCLRKTAFPVDVDTNFWQNPKFTELRELNKTNVWSAGCSNCESLEKSNLTSFRLGMNEGLGLNFKTDLSGPARIDLMFDISCNLACRTCGTDSSTYWQKHLKEHNLWNQPISPGKSRDEVIQALTKLDLSNLRMLVFCGGETLLGQEYWEVARWLGDNVPNAKENLTLCFQTNGTQPIQPRNYGIIEKFHLVKLHISLDGVANRFEYLRWPAEWKQVSNNILELKHSVPGNVMFLVEETISIFNLAYLDELSRWVQDNFSTSREGDVINHTQHIAGGIYSIDQCTQEYVDAVQQTKFKNLIPANWTENPTKIKKMIAEIKQFDRMRNESFAEVFPTVAGYYSRFL